MNFCSALQILIDRDMVKVYDKSILMKYGSQNVIIFYCPFCGKKFKRTHDLLDKLNSYKNSGNDNIQQDNNKDTKEQDDDLTEFEYDRIDKLSVAREALSKYLPENIITTWLTTTNAILGVEPIKVIIEQEDGLEQIIAFIKRECNNND